MVNQTQPTNPAVITRRDLEARIIAKAWRNPAYKQRLLADAKAVLQSEISAIDASVALPTALQVQVHEEAPNTYHLVLPRNPRNIALSEILPDDLEAVAPQTVAIVVLGVVAGNTVAVVNNVGAGNVVAAGNVATTGNAVANFNAIA
jgi:hypothetical protein